MSNNYKCYIWKRNTEKPTSYEVFYHRDGVRRKSAVIFSNDPEVEVVMDDSSNDQSQIIDLDTGDSQNIASRFNFVHSFTGSFCIHKKGIVLYITLFDQLIIFFYMDSGAILYHTYQRYLKVDESGQRIKLSPKETMLAFPNYKSDMVFLQLSIPQNPLLHDIKQLAVDGPFYILKQNNDDIFNTSVVFFVEKNP